MADRIIDTKDDAECAILFNKFDKLDREQTGYMLAAERHAGCPPPNGIYEWSPHLE